MTPKEQAQKLINEGYCQVSGRYRILAKLPEGKTAVEALIEADPRWKAKFEDIALGQYLRVYSQTECQAELDIETFAEFRRLGGKVA